MYARRSRIFGLTLGLVLLALTASACADDGDTAADDSTEGASETGEATREESPSADVGGESGDAFVIGVTHDLTGPTAFRAVPEVAGLRTYIDALNDRGGVHGRSVELQVLDDQYDTATALTNFERLVEAGALTVIGPGNSSASPALQQAAEEQGIALLSAVMPSPVEQTPANVFQPMIDNPLVTPASLPAFAAQLAADEGIEEPSVALVFLDSASGEFLEGAIREAVESQGWSVATSQTVSSEAGAEFSAGAAEIANANPDYILMGVHEGATPAVVEAIRRRNVTVPIVNYISGATESLFVQLADPAYYAWRHVVSPEEDLPAVDEMRQRATEAGHDNEMTSYEFTFGYVEGMLIEKALDACGAGCDRSSMQDAIASVDDVDTEGLTGPDMGFGPDDRVFHEQIRFYQYDEEAAGSVAVTDWFNPLE